jgi:chromosome segregation ATPase
MATGRNRCVLCGKDKATLRCGGCSQEFCFNHLADHRQELNKQLDKVEVTRDLFRQAFTEEITNPRQHIFIQQINDWERDSIEKIRQTAEEARKQLLKYITEHIEQIEIKLSTLTEELRQRREENDFYETDIHHWNEELTRLAKELAEPSNIHLRQNIPSLINKISVDITSGNCNNRTSF